MEATDEGSAANDRRYAMLDQRDIPGGENLKVTLNVHYHSGKMKLRQL